MVGIKEHFVGRLNYNGFEFPPAIKANMVVRPVKDSSGRYTKYSAYMLTVECVIHENVDEFSFNPGTGEFEENTSNKLFLPNIAAPKTGSIDGYTTLGGRNTAFGMVALRRLLLEQGRRLIFTDKGVGWDFDIDGIQGDILYGPVPHLINWEPLGSSKAVRIVWAVEVTIADCLVIKAPWGDVAEYSTDLEWSISVEGLTRRTITGMIEVPQRVFAFSQLRQGNSADVAREVFVPPCPPGFRRVVNRYSLARTRNILNFQIVDEEYPSDNPYFKGIVDANVNANVRNPQPINMAIWHVTIDGNITVSKSHPRYFAWIAFLSVVYARLEAAVEHSRAIVLDEADPGPGESPGEDDESFSAATKKALQHVIIRSLSITEQVFGRGMSFSMTWEIHPDIESMIEASGLWSPNSEVLDTGEKSSGESTWEKHQDSMNSPVGVTSLAAPWGPRGTAGMQHDLTMDYIKNLCAPRQIGKSLGLHFKPSHRIRDPVFRFPCRVDYYRLQQSVEIIEDPQSYRLAPLGGQSPVHQEEVRDATVGTRVPSGYADFSSITGATNDEVLQPIVQTRGHTQVLARYTGRVRRCGRPPVMWRLIKYGDANVVRQIGTGSWRMIDVVKADSNGRPHFEIEWDAVYQLDRPPNGNLIKSRAPDPLKFPP